MCDPVTLSLAALSVAGSVDAVNKQNKAHVANRENAMQAQNDQIDDQGRQFVENNRSLVQGGFDSILAGREAEADSYTSAIANGVSGASVKAMLMDTRQKASRNATRTKQEQGSLRTQTGANFKHIKSSTQGRINSVSSTKFGIGDAASALTPIVRSQME